MKPDKNIIPSLKTDRLKRLRKLALISGICFIVFLIIVPAPKFDTPYSTAIYSRNSILLYAQVAKDEQWRFSETQGLPEKYIKALLEFEDRKFYYHPGVNPATLFKSAWRNLKARKIVSGASTITMQLARLSRKNPPRTFSGKFWEILMALKAECVYSKKTILRKYAAHAPFGSNVVGLEAACWRFLGVEPEQISWAQAATLAVLPNSPALIFPGRNQEVLKEKRNRLLKQLFNKGYFDEMTYSLALEEPVPGKPKPMPQNASLLAVRLANEGEGGKTIRTSINANFQRQAELLVARYQEIYEANKIHNAAVLVVEVESGKVLAYVGNTYDSTQNNGNMVDMITAKRSYGSTLKPVLYMAAMDAGIIAPESVLPDYPISFGSFNPKNYDLDHNGIIPVNKALIRSLNIPNVVLLKRLGTHSFLNTLQQTGMTTFKKSAQYYGLSLILGGAESNIWELTGLYAALASKVDNPSSNNFTLSYLAESKSSKLNSVFHTKTFNPASIWTAFNVMMELYRPGDDGHWEMFSSSQKIAWKTGTSFGGRDAWAIGINSKYVVCAWVGNASGEGRASLTGTDMAAPIMLDLFSLLPQSTWFKKPKDGWTKTKICVKSGMPAAANCPDYIVRNVPSGSSKSPSCSYHQIVHLDSSLQYRVNSSCMNPADMITQNWFVLSPPEAMYYMKRHSDYLPLPPFREDCRMNSGTTSNPISLIYPSNNAKIYIPKDRDGELGRAVFSAAHQDPSAKIHWHADRSYLGTTEDEHKMEIALPAGLHHFTLVDENGNTLSFQVNFLQK